jgi:Ser/Thr protein kinase RdoA (MazF antagonist)
MTPADMKLTQQHLLSVVRHFRIPEQPAAVIRTGSGHINETYLVRVMPNGAPGYVLQWINHHIFSDVPALMENIRKVTEHLGGKAGFDPLHLVPTNQGNFFFHSGEGDYWRLYNYIAGSRSYDVLGTPERAREAGKAFGLFQQLTSDLDGSSLTETIPQFHHMGSRLQKFRQAVSLDPAGRASGLVREIGFVEQRATEMMLIRELLESGRLPLRVTHNDTKCNNILFDGNDRALCVIDLDTVMPGTILYDYGDAIRTGAARTAEDERDLRKVGLDMDLFENYTAGYLSVARDFLVPAELEHLDFAPRFMTFLIGLRFLTDHLEEDTYYRISYPEHNLVRARVQFRMVEEMERSAASLRTIIHKYAYI